LVNKPEYRVFREVSTYEAFYKLYPEMLERETLECDTTECICKAMDEKNLTCKQLADKVGWSKKKLKRVLSGDISITVRQLARLLFACGCRAKIAVEEQHEITT
jgi:antitoxin component HigA of HigAB toxin-antitoxin module